MSWEWADRAWKVGDMYTLIHIDKIHGKRPLGSFGWVELGDGEPLPDFLKHPDVKLSVVGRHIVVKSEDAPCHFDEDSEKPVGVLINKPKVEYGVPYRCYEVVKRRGKYVPHGDPNRTLRWKEGDPFPEALNEPDTSVRALGTWVWDDENDYLGHMV